MKVLLVKLSSLGDVVHAMPAVQDMRRALPGVEVDWVVERGFAPLVRQCAGVRRVVESDIRGWRSAPLSRATRVAWRAFKSELQAQAYDAVIDLQGLTKSAIVSRLARLAPGGRRYALGNKTEGAGWEPPTRWVADVAIQVEPHIHAVQRSRELCARALGYAVPAVVGYGLGGEQQGTAKDESGGARDEGGVARGTIAFVHGTSRADKLWPDAHWVELGKKLIAEGWRVALPHGGADEKARSEALERALGASSEVWPALPLDRMTERLGGVSGVIGVDSGLSHIAVALDLPHVQVYNFDTAWRTGPLASARQESVYSRPTPSVDTVWQAWRHVSPERGPTPAAPPSPA